METHENFSLCMNSEQAGPSTSVENSDYYNELVALKQPKIGDDESIIKAKNEEKNYKKYKKI